MTDKIPDPYNLNRFIAAQEIWYEIATGELRVGRKHAHWMWFIFPQFEGLGSSSRSKHYSIKSLDEARQYVQHLILGTRLIGCTKLVTSNKSSVLDIFGMIDAMKFRSSMTLFEHVSEPGSVFTCALDTCCEGQRDLETMKLIKNWHHWNGPNKSSLPG